jgi:hypothetical protein
MLRVMIWRAHQGRDGAVPEKRFARHGARYQVVTHDGDIRVGRQSVQLCLLHPSRT